MSLTTIAMRLRYAVSNPHGWQQFLDEKYEGGKALVNNPDPDGRKKQVSVNYALKTESFRHRLSEEYHKWYGENKEKAKNRGRPKKVNPDSKPVSAPETTPEPPIKAVYGPHKALLGQYTVEGILEQYKDHFQSLMNQIPRKAVNEGKESNQNVNYLFNNALSKSDAKLSDNISYWMQLGNFKGKIQKAKKAKIKRDNVLKMNIWGYSMFLRPEIDLDSTCVLGWTCSTTDPESKKLFKFLSDSDVKGSKQDFYETPAVWESSSEERIFKEKIAKGYAYQQAVFKHLDVTHIDLYRGIASPNLNSKSIGDRVQIQSREASSWSGNPEVASRFGTHIIHCRVPVERIILSPIVGKRLEGDSFLAESEFVVMGAEDLEGCRILLSEDTK